MCRVKLFSILLAGIFAFLGCDKIPFLKPKASSKPPAGAVIVAEVGNSYITLDDLNKEVESYNNLVTSRGKTQDKIDTKEKKIKYLQDEVERRYLFYHEALRRGLDTKEEVVKALDETKVLYLAAELIREELDKIDVSAKEIEEFYNKNKELIKEPEQRKVREIVTETEDEAKQVYIELLKGADFAEMAKVHSKAASKDKGGDLGFMIYEFQAAKRTRFEKFYEIAFAPGLEAGSTSGIFKGPDGYYIIKVENIIKTEPKPLSELWDNIKNFLSVDKQQKAIEGLVGRLKNEIKVETYEGKIN